MTKLLKFNANPAIKNAMGELPIKYCLENKNYKITLGTGVFYEKERSISNNLDVNTFRANLYSQYVYQNKGEYPYKAFGTIYVQPSISEPDDYRVLAIGGFEFSVSENIKVVIETELKHNSTPFENIEKTDFEYGVRLAYQF